MRDADIATEAMYFGVEDSLPHIIKGRGASVELLEGKELPGVAALDR